MTHSLLPEGEAPPVCIPHDKSLITENSLFLVLIWLKSGRSIVLLGHSGCGWRLGHSGCGWRLGHSGCGLRLGHSGCGWRLGHSWCDGGLSLDCSFDCLGPYAWLANSPPIINHVYLLNCDDANKSAHVILKLLTIFFMFKQRKGYKNGCSDATNTDNGYYWRGNEHLYLLYTSSEKCNPCFV